ncbi:hypothetical protein [Jatrophihabitans fulvus]
MTAAPNKPNPTVAVLRTAVRAEQLLVRTPLALAAGVAASKLGRRSPVATTLERGVEVLDAAAERLLASLDPAGSPQPRPEAHPEPQAPTASRPGTSDPEDIEDAVDVTAPEVEVAGPEEALPAEETEVVEHVAEELLEEQEHKPLAGELSEDDELRRVQAELHAKHLVEEQAQERSAE